MPGSSCENMLIDLLETSTRACVIANADGCHGTCCQRRSAGLAPFQRTDHHRREDGPAPVVCAFSSAADVRVRWSARDGRAALRSFRTIPSGGREEPISPDRSSEGPGTSGSSKPVSALASIPSASPRCVGSVTSHSRACSSQTVGTCGCARPERYPASSRSTYDMVTSIAPKGQSRGKPRFDYTPGVRQ